MRGGSDEREAPTHVWPGDRINVGPKEEGEHHNVHNLSIKPRKRTSVPLTPCSERMITYFEKKIVAPIIVRHDG